MQAPFPDNGVRRKKLRSNPSNYADLVSAAADGLIGQAPSEQAIRDAAASLQGMIEPAGNVHSTTEYQRHVAGVLTERALRTAARRVHDGH